MERKEVVLRIKEILKRSEDTHDIYTPLELCEEMIEKLPEINSNTNVLVMFNLEFLWTLREKLGKEGTKNVWFLTPCELKKKAAVGMGIDENQTVKYSYNNKQIEGEEKMPKFDVVVGNPPYKKDLHLIMLKLACSILKPDGEIVWLHPARWLQDPLALRKKNSDFKKYHILPFIKIDVIPMMVARKAFDVGIQGDLIISQLKNNRKSILNEDKIYELRSILPAFKKLLKTNFTSINDVIEYDKREGIRVRIPLYIYPGSSPGGEIEAKKGKYNLVKKNHIVIDGMINGKDWIDFYAKNQFSKPKGSPLPLSICFGSVKEAENFIDSTNTEIFLFFNFLTKVDAIIHLKYLPFMGDYSEPWTNERFAEAFSISEEELEYIKKRMTEYRDPANEHWD